MKKLEINENNYQLIVLKASIITCWALLIICCIIKMIGGNYFNIICGSERFIKFCDFIDKSFVKYIIYFILFQFTMYLLLTTISPELKIRSCNYVGYFIVITLYWIYKLLIETQVLIIPYYLIDIIDFIFSVFILYLYTRKFKNSLVIVIMLYIFTLISTITKSIGMQEMLTDSYLVATLFNIDYYIMLILCKLYSKKIYLRRQK